MHRAIAIALLAFAAPAAAGPASTGERRARARAHEQEGLKAQAAGAYDRAVDDYQRAYDLAPVTGLIFNMAEAHRLAGHHALALAHYRRYLAAEPTGLAAREAAARIGPLEAAVARDEARRAEEARLAEETRVATETRLKEEARLANEAREAAEEALWIANVRRQDEERRAREALAARRAELELGHARDAAQRRGRFYRVTGATIGVSGLVITGFGVYFAQRARTLSAQVAAQYDERAFARGETAEQLQVAALSLGGAAAIGGAALVYVGWRTTHRLPRLSVAPVAAGAAMIVSGAW